jgi:O-antigen ligase
MTAIIFLALFAAGLGAALFRHPRWGLYTYVALFYLHPPSRWWAESLPDLRWSYMAALVTVIATLMLPKDKDKTRTPWYSTTPAKLLIAYTVWVWMQWPWALAPETHLYLCTLYVKYIVIFFLIYKLIDTRERVVEFLLCHLGGCLYLGYLGLSARYAGRLNGLGGPGIDEANLLAAQLATAVVIGAMLLLSERGWRWWFTAAAVALSMNTMVMAGSRGAFLSVLVAGAVLWYMKPKAYSKVFYVYAALAIVAVLSVAQQAFWDRMTTISSATEYETADLSAQNRMQGFTAQLRMAASYPHGAGHRGTAVLSPQYMDPMWLTGDPPQRSSHNTFATALVEQGIPGLYFFLAFWWYVFKTMMARRRTLTDPEAAQLNAVFAATGGAFAVVFVAGNFVDFVKAEIMIWLLATLACLVEIARKQATVTSAAPTPAAAKARVGPRYATPRQQQSAKFRN